MLRDPSTPLRSAQDDRIFPRLNTSEERTCIDSYLEKQNQYYEKTDHSFTGPFSRGAVDLVCIQARDNYHHNNHSGDGGSSGGVLNDDAFDDHRQVLDPLKGLSALSCVDFVASRQRAPSKFQ